MSRDKCNAQALPSLASKLRSTKVLLVGAGGIGCELLKNLVLSGFGNIEIIDLDTIDLSNLNRQFLFRQVHIKKSKALVAKEVADRFRAGRAEREDAGEKPGGDDDGNRNDNDNNNNKNGGDDDDNDDDDNYNIKRDHEACRDQSGSGPASTATDEMTPVSITAHHANIKDAEFNVDYFGGFDLVFNALDNLDARRHVNRMCLAADTPLIESGTTGFEGQVQVIKKGVTECYDCNPKPVAKSFPVCTIRSTPSQPIHCIVWAKSYLLPELFGRSEDADNFDYSADAENAEELQNLRLEAEALQAIRDSMAAPDFAEKVFDKVFGADIERLRGMEDMWKTKRPPEPLSYKQVVEGVEKVPADVATKDQKVWGLEENVAVFKDSASRLAERLLSTRAGDDEPSSAEPSSSESADATITFDKDDNGTLDFVAASANIRSHIFHIPTHTKFQIKEMAGNIIPAIATTNAMTAALCVLQAHKVLSGALHAARMTFLERAGARAINTDTLKPPNPRCPVCSTAVARLEVNSANARLEHVVHDVLRGAQLGYADCSIVTDAGIIFDPDMEDNLPKPLAEVGVMNGAFVTVMDEGGDDDAEDQGLRVNLQFIVEETRDKDAVQTVALKEVPAIPRRRKETTMERRSEEPAPPAPAAPVSEPVGLTSPATSVGTKRKRGGDDDGVEEIVDSPIRKSTKEEKDSTAVTANGQAPQQQQQQPAVVEIEDDVDAIVLDD